MDDQTTTTAAEVANVVNNAIDKARTVSELAFLVVVVVVSILAVVLIPMVLNAWQARNERRETRDLERDHNEMIAKSHERTAEAICKLADNDSRSIECQQQMQRQLTLMQERGIVMETVVDECLAIAQQEVGSESISADIGRIRKRLEIRKS